MSPDPPSISLPRPVSGSRSGCMFQRYESGWSTPFIKLYIMIHDLSRTGRQPCRPKKRILLWESLPLLHQRHSSDLPVRRLPPMPILPFGHRGGAGLEAAPPCLSRHPRRLARALAAGKDQFPEAARAQPIITAVCGTPRSPARGRQPDLQDRLVPRWSAGNPARPASSAARLRRPRRIDFPFAPPAQPAPLRHTVYFDFDS